MNDEPAASSQPVPYPYQRWVRRAIDRAPYTVISIFAGATAGALRKGPAGAFLGAMLLGLIGLGIDLAAGKERPEGDTAS